MTRKEKVRLGRIVAAAVLLTVLAFLPFSEIFPARNHRLIEAGLYLVPYFLIGGDIIRKALHGVLNGEVLDENFLMTIATVGAMFLGEYNEGAAVMLFYQIGEFFQSYAVGKSRKNIAQLMDIRPDYANIESDGEIKKVDPDEVEIGSIIVVEPGGRIPIDGTIIKGNTILDTRALTGESRPRRAGTGDTVLSGCINLTGMILVRTTKAAGESTAAKIIELIENSGLKKARSEKFISRFARVYTPIVCAMALFLAGGVPLIRQFFWAISPEWPVWIERALVLLVISCPCALVISIPLSFFGGIGAASRNGILVKGSNYIENLAATKYVVFDKTGTLTKGVFKVTKIKPAGDLDEAELLKYAAYAECYSPHPISRSLKNAYAAEIEREYISAYEEISGHGVKAKVKGRMVAAGNQSLMQKIGVTIAIEKEEAGTIVHVAVDGKYAGYIVISDEIKESAKPAIAELRKLGIKEIVMLTGDREEAAKAVAAEIAVDRYVAGLFPTAKVKEMEKLIAAKDKAEKLAFVGDGINDAPVLLQAETGIAMGALGSDAAIEAADIVLMDDQPIKIPLAIKIARKTLGIVKQNIWFTIGVKAVCLIGGALGLANMWLAIFADVGVTIIAVLNAVRALGSKY